MVYSTTCLIHTKYWAYMCDSPRWWLWLLWAVSTGRDWAQTAAPTSGATNRAHARAAVGALPAAGWPSEPSPNRHEGGRGGSTPVRLAELDPPHAHARAQGLRHRGGGAAVRSWAAGGRDALPARPHPSPLLCAHHPYPQLCGVPCWGAHVPPQGAVCRRQAVAEEKPASPTTTWR